jgi:hypothetical protein
VKSLFQDDTPYVVSLMQQVQKMKIDPQHLTPLSLSLKSKPRVVVVYLLGGISLNEAIELQNLKERDFEIVAGGTHLLNTAMYFPR